jgi:Protein of unknown function (DUF2934)
MDIPHQTFHESTILLAALFQTRTHTPLHESCGNACHAFEMYDARNAMVREAAYLRAQLRGFEPNHELEDWLTAEHDVDACLFAEMAPVGFVG